jgi:polar amino acid transport system substrate-binding protein
MTEALACPACGSWLPADAPEGLCPKCLLQGALSTQPGPLDPKGVPGIDQLARFFPQLQILELLGQGGMGAVFKARQQGLDRLVALKILPPETGRDPAFAERFLREAQSLARLSHPNVVAVHDFGQAGGLSYLVMEYVDGVDLRHVLRAGPTRPEEALRIAAQVAEALHYAHEEGIVHRDVKPENILLDHKGRVKIADFGLAKLLSHTPAAPVLTTANQVMGTMHYMAPEQSERPLEVDLRTDLFALGVVLYELLTRELPLGSFALPSQKVPVGGSVDAIVLRALAKEPDRRYQSAADMKRAIEEATQEVSPPPTVVYHGTAEGKEGRRWSRWWLLGGAGITLLCAVLLPLAWPYFQSPPIAGDTLRWGGDASGGAPYIIDRGPSKEPTGFEAELADYLAARLGLRPQFVQKSWDVLGQDLNSRHDFDVILNGFEWSPENEEYMASTIPYYVYKLQLVARKNDASLRGWEDLRAKPGQRRKKVGVLSNSASDRYLKKEFGQDVEIVSLGEEGTTGVMLKVQAGSLDATLQDLPAALYYIKQKQEFPGLELVGAPIKPVPYNFYVLFVRKKDDRLREQLDAALLDAIRDGTLKRIYESYGLWDADQEQLAEAARHWPPDASATPLSLANAGLVLGKAALVTIVLACLSMPLAMLMGLLVAVGRLYGPRWLDWPLGAYVEILRGTPLLLQLFVIFYVLPSATQIDLPAFWAGILALAINYSAYEAENYRAGLMAIPRGQMEAALSLGMSTGTALRRVIVPQAVRIVIPPVTNDFIALFKDTSVCSVISVVELTGGYRVLMTAHPKEVLVLGAMTALLYFLMSYPLSLVARRLERRYPRVVM